MISDHLKTGVVPSPQVCMSNILYNRQYS